MALYTSIYLRLKSRLVHSNFMVSGHKFFGDKIKIINLNNYLKLTTVEFDEMKGKLLR
jgi:hypothetical protein